VAEDARGVEAILVAVAGGELEDGKVHGERGTGRGEGSVDQLETEVLDDGIAEEAVCGVAEGFLCGGLIGAGCEVDLDVFADVDPGDAGVAHVLEGVLDCFALGIEDGFLGGDDDSGLHEDGCRKPVRTGPETLKDDPGVREAILGPYGNQWGSDEDLSWGKSVGGGSF
jgi:hypothetical protein